MDRSERILKVLEYIKFYGSISNIEAQSLLDIHRNTATEYFKELTQQGIIVPIGKGKGTRYFLRELLIFSEKEIRNQLSTKQKTSFNNYLNKANRAKVFFNKTQDKALEADFSFEHEIEAKFIEAKKVINNRRKDLSDAERKRKKEKLIIDLSWASSRIEGNTYSLLETETLIKYNQTPQGKTFAEAKMILNHKNVLEYIRNNDSDYKKINKTKILELHQLLIDGLNVNTGFRNHLVQIANSSFIPCDNIFQITSFFEKIINEINKRKSVLEKSVMLNLLLAYLQPFSDGNKRTSRMAGNAILISNNYLPISFSHTSKEEYIKSMLIFYEKQDASYFKHLFLNELNKSFVEYLA